MQIRSLFSLPNHVLLRELRLFISAEQEATAQVVQHVGEVWARRLHVSAGYPRLPHFLTSVYGYSEAAAYRRATAGKLAHRFPFLVPAVAEHRLTLTTLVELAPHITKENAEELFRAAEGMKRRRVLELIAERFPQPDLPEQIARVVFVEQPVATPAQEKAAENELFALARIRPTNGTAEVAAEPVSTDVPPTTLAPISDGTAQAMARGTVVVRSTGHHAVQFMISDEENELLQHARDLLAHGMPGAGAKAVFMQALREMVHRMEKQKFATTEKPAAPRPDRDPETISAATKRTVWLRACGQCEYVSPAGRRCDEHGDLEYDHVVSRAKGGDSSPPNIQLLCSEHHRMKTEEEFGTAFIAGKIERSRMRHAGG